MTEQLAEKIAQVEAPQTQAVEPEKQHVERTGWRKLVPQFFIDNAVQVSNAGLFTFSSIMMLSSLKGKKIGGEIYDAQVKLLEKSGLGGEALTQKVDELLKNGTMKKPALHKMRLAYLLTAVTSFGTGTIFKRKEEKQEDLARYEQMSLPEYMGTRVKEALDPVHHSRQTVGVLSTASGVMTVMSALSQPGGKHQSELFIGSLYTVGSLLLTFLKDASSAQQAFTSFWMARIPFIGSGAYESLALPAAYKHPLVGEMKQSAEYIEGMKKAVLEDGVKAKPWWGFNTPYKKHYKGADAAVPFDQAFAVHKLPNPRRDYAYPVGQVGNLTSAIIGIAGKKPTTKQGASESPAPALVAEDTPKPTTPTVTTAEAPQVELALAHETPSTKVGHIEKPPHEHGRVEAKELVPQQMTA
jgi:hypothetical protein